MLNGKRKRGEERQIDISWRFMGYGTVIFRAIELLCKARSFFYSLTPVQCVCVYVPKEERTPAVT